MTGKEKGNERRLAEKVSNIGSRISRFLPTHVLTHTRAHEQLSGII